MDSRVPDEIETRLEVIEQRDSIKLDEITNVMVPNWIRLQTG